MSEVDTEKRGIPVEETDEGNVVTARGRWSVGDDDVRPGDVIEWPSALGDPRYIEHLTQDVPDDMDEQPLLVANVPLDEPVHPCTFCSTKVAIAERGIIDSDHKLVTNSGKTVAYTCHGCLSRHDSYPVDGGDGE